MKDGARKKEGRRGKKVEKGVACTERQVGADAVGADGEG